MSGNCCSRISGSRTRPPARHGSPHPWKREPTSQKSEELFAGRRRVDLNLSGRRPRILQTSCLDRRITLSLRMKENRAENSRTLARISSMARRLRLHKGRHCRSSRVPRHFLRFPTAFPGPLKKQAVLFEVFPDHYNWAEIHPVYSLLIG